jgi:hypothetical protein
MDNDLGLEGKWIQLEDIVLRGVSQAQKDKGSCFLSFMEDRSKDKHIHKIKHDQTQTQM